MAITSRKGPLEYIWHSGRRLRCRGIRYHPFQVRFFIIELIKGSGGRSQSGGGLCNGSGISLSLSSLLFLHQLLKLSLRKWRLSSLIGGINKGFRGNTSL